MNKYNLQKKLLFTIIFTIACQINLLSQNAKTDSLLLELKTAKDDTNKVNTLYITSRHFLYTDPDKALKYSNIAVRLADSINFHKGKAASLDILGIYYQNKGEFNEAEEFYQNSLDIRNMIKDPRLISVSYNNFGVLNRKKGEFLKAKEYFLKALKINKELNDNEAQSRVYNNLGLLMDNLGNYEESINYHLKSLRIREELGNKRDIASSLNNIGIVFLSIKKYEEALEYLTKSLKIKEEIGNKRSQASSYVNIGNVFYYQNRFDDALNNYNKSLKVYQDLDDKRSISATLSNMSYIARKKGDLQLASMFNLESIDIIEKIGSLDEIFSAYNGASATLYDLKKYKKAKYYAIKAKEIATGNNILPQLKTSLKMLHLIYANEKNYKQANSYLLQFIDVKDSLLNESNNKQILELQTKYNTEKKEKEIVLLSKKSIQQELKLEKRKKIISILIGAVLIVILTTITIIRLNKIKQKQKAIILEQKLLRTQMNPHFIFNAISAIQHYIHKNKSLEASSYLSNFAKLMRSILNNSKVELVTLKDEKQTLEDYLKLQCLRLDGNLDYTLEGISEIDSDELAIPPMLLQPFIENSIEHGILKKKEQSGKIDIVFSKKNSKLTVEITDNGIGREKAGNLEDKDHHSFATEITNSRIKSMKLSYKKNVSFNIEDLKNSDNIPIGTKVIFELPLIYI